MNLSVSIANRIRNSVLAQVVSLLLLGMLVAAGLVIFSYSPPKVPVEKIAAPVSVLRVQAENTPVVISGFGTVEASRELEIRPQVSGHLVRIHPALEIGGRVNQEEILVQIDPSDYQIEVESQRAALQRAEFELKLEQGNQVVAAEEWKLLEGDITSSELGKELALRKPHIAEKRAALRAANSRLRKAELDLARTSIVAPFDALVLEESVEQSKFVNPQIPIARLAGTAEFHIQVKIPRASLHWLHPASDGSFQAGSCVVSWVLESGQRVSRSGVAKRLLGEVDTAGRMARVLVGVSDPLDPAQDDPLLLLGSYVKVEFSAVKLSEVYRLPRNALRESGVVWVVASDNTLAHKKVRTVFTHGDFVFLQGELSERDLVVTNPLPGALEGMLLEVHQAEGGTSGPIQRAMSD